METPQLARSPEDASSPPERSAPSASSAPGTVGAATAPCEWRSPLRSDRLFRALWQDAADGLCVTDARGIVHVVNVAYCRMVDKSPADIEGKPLSIIEAADCQSQVLRDYQRRFASRLIPPRYEKHATLWNGATVHFELSNSYIELDEHGPFLLSVVRDIGERLGRQEEHSRLLRERAQLADHLGLVLESTAEGILGVDRQGRCTFINRAAAKLLGYGPGELLGRDLHLLFHPSEEPAETAAARCPLCRTFTDVQPCRLEPPPTVRADGETFAAEYLGYPIMQDGTLRGAVLTFSDRSEQKQLEAQFRHAQKMEAVGRLAGGVAHDFNNLLTVILGQSEFLLASVEAAPPSKGASRVATKIAEGLLDIKNAAERAASLTRQLLLFSRKQITSPVILSLNTVIANDKMMLRLLGEDIQVSTKLDPQLGHIKADPGQIHQVILNLVINARDAMPRGGKLIIETANVDLDDSHARKHLDAPPGPYVLLAITDSGCGMSAEVQSHLFEPFYTTKEPGKGTGLGLSTVYGIVKQNAGHIDVTSAPGQGTSFRVYLPRIHESIAGDVPEQKFSTPPPVPKTILVVEDEDMVRRMICLSLWWNGYTVLEAPGGPEALTLAETHTGPIHLLLTDVLMPGMNGNELATRLIQRRPNVEVLYVSGYTGGMLDDLFQTNPRAAFLQKPFTPDSLTRKVAEVLEQRTAAGQGR